MRAALRPHSDLPSGPVTGIEVEAERRADGVILRFRLTGAISDLAIPPVGVPGRADELWRHTCFEAFLRPDGGERYFEFNFAPSSEWAAYRFTSYREGMAQAEVAPPDVAVSQANAALELTARLDLAGLQLPPGPCRLALSAVIEQASGEKSYWALAHPPGRPDFHHRTGFALELP